MTAQYLLQTHPKVACYRTRHLPDYRWLCEIFGDSIANERGGFADNSQLPPQAPLTHMQVEGEEDVQNQTIDEEAGEEHVSTASAQISTPQVSSRQTSRRQSVGDTMTEIVGWMIDSLDRLANAQERLSVTQERLAIMQDVGLRMRSFWEALESLDIDLDSKVRVMLLL